MATVNLGKIKLKWRGTYASGTAYTPDDVVAYTDGSVTSSYICVTASTGNAPSSGGSAHSSWNFLAKGQNASPTTNQGDIIVRGASADGRLAVGSAGQVLKVNSSGNGLEYGSGSTVLQVKNLYYSNTRQPNKKEEQMSKKKNKPDKYWKDELQRLLNILANRDNDEDAEEVPPEED